MFLLGWIVLGIMSALDVNDQLNGDTQVAYVWLLCLLGPFTVILSQKILFESRKMGTFWEVKGSPNFSPIVYVITDLTKSGGVFRVGVLLDFVRRSGTTRAEGPHGGASYVRGAKRNRINPPLGGIERPAAGTTWAARSSSGAGSSSGSVRVTSRSVSPPWRSIRFRLALRTYAPWGCIVRVVSQAKSRKIPTRKILPLFFASRHLLRPRHAASAEQHLLRLAHHQRVHPAVPQLVRVAPQPFNSTPMGANAISPAHLHVRPMGVHRTCTCR